MSIHAFGNNVDEVQRKLSEILPLTDAGAERLQQLHATLQTELAEYRAGYENLQQSNTSVATEAAQLGGDVTNVQSDIETGANTFMGGLAQIGSEAKTAVDQLNAAREQVETSLEGQSQQLQSGTTSAESQLDAMAENVDTLQEQVTTLQTQAETAFAEVDQHVGEHDSTWNQEEAKSQESINAFKSAIASTHRPEAKQKFDGFNANTVETVGNVVDLFTEKDGGLSDFFSAFDTDAETMAEQFQARTRQTFGELKECAEDECGKAVQESFEHLGKEVVEAFAAEIIASIATTQLGVATTGSLSLIIPELVIAKKITGAINSIL